MASKKENIDTCSDILLILKQIKDSLQTKPTTGYMTVEIDKYLTDAKSMLNKVKEFYR